MAITKRDAALIATTVLIVIGGVAGFLVTRNNAVAGSSDTTRYYAYESPRPFQVPETYQLNVFAEPSLNSQILVQLPPSAIALSIGAYGLSADSAEWHKVRTQSGSVGWYKAPDVRAITVQHAEERILRDQQDFEQAVRTAISDAVSEKIGELGIHGGGPPDEIHFTAPLTTTESAAVFRAPVSAIMHGTIISSNKYQVDLVVSLFLHVNKDHIPASTIEISNVEYLGYDQTSGFSGSDVVRLFGPMGIF